MDVLAIIGSLAVVALVLAATYYATRWYARRMGSPGGTGKHIKVLDRAALAAGVSVAIVEVDGRYYLLGIGEKQVNLLCELTDFAPPDDADAATAIPFSQAFRQVLDKTLRKGGDHRQ